MGRTLSIKNFPWPVLLFTGVGRPLVDVRLRRRLGVARVRVFPEVHLGSRKIREGSAGDQRAHVESRTGIERFVAVVIHASNAGAGGDYHIIEII